MTRKQTSAKVSKLAGYYLGMSAAKLATAINKATRDAAMCDQIVKDTRAVDAFSFLRDDRPFIFLNNYKTAQHSIYDSAHELAHLVMHRHAGAQPATRVTEREANQFGSAFLMPKNDVRSRMPRFITVDLIIKAKARWRVGYGYGVSAALARLP